MRGAQKSSSLISNKVDSKLIAEDFKKYEDKTSKKIKPGIKLKIWSIYKITDSFEKMGSTLGVDIYHDVNIHKQF